MADRNNINKLDLSKATGLDCLGPRIIKRVVDSLSPSIAKLIIKVLRMENFHLS